MPGPAVALAGRRAPHGLAAWGRRRVPLAGCVGRSPRPPQGPSLGKKIGQAELQPPRWTCGGRGRFQGPPGDGRPRGLSAAPVPARTPSPAWRWALAPESPRPAQGFLCLRLSVAVQAATVVGSAGGQPHPGVSQAHLQPAPAGAVPWEPGSSGLDAHGGWEPDSGGSGLCHSHLPPRKSQPQVPSLECRGRGTAGTWRTAGVDCFLGLVAGDHLLFLPARGPPAGPQAAPTSGGLAWRVQPAAPPVTLWEA